MSSNFSKLKVFILLLASTAIGLVIGARFPADPDDEALSNSIDNLKEVLFHIERDYVDTVDLDKLTEYGIQQMLEELDPHSVYIPPESWRWFKVN